MTNVAKKAMTMVLIVNLQKTKFLSLYNCIYNPALSYRLCSDAQEIPWHILCWCWSLVHRRSKLLAYSRRANIIAKKPCTAVSLRRGRNHHLYDKPVEEFLIFVFELGAIDFKIGIHHGDPALKCTVILVI